MNAIRTYFLFTLATLVGMSWFFQKINQQDFYVHYFRSIAEITERNSQAIDYQTEVEFHFATLLPEWKDFVRVKSLFLASPNEFLRELIFSSFYNIYRKISLPKIAFSLTQQKQLSIISKYLSANGWWHFMGRGWCNTIFHCKSHKTFVYNDYTLNRINFQF